MPLQMSRYARRGIEKHFGTHRPYFRIIDIRKQYFQQRIPADEKRAEKACFPFQRRFDFICQNQGPVTVKRRNFFSEIIPVKGYSGRFGGKIAAVKMKFIPILHLPVIAGKNYSCLKFAIGGMDFAEDGGGIFQTFHGGCPAVNADDFTADAFGFAGQGGGTRIVNVVMDHAAGQA